MHDPSMKVHWIVLQVKIKGYIVYMPELDLLQYLLDFSQGELGNCCANPTNDLGSINLESLGLSIITV